MRTLKIYRVGNGFRVMWFKNQDGYTNLYTKGPSWSMEDLRLKSHGEIDYDDEFHYSFDEALSFARRVAQDMMNYWGSDVQIRWGKDVLPLNGS